MEKVHDSIPRQLMTETGKHKPCGKDCFNLKVKGDAKLGKDVVIEFEKTSKAVGNDWKVRRVRAHVSVNHTMQENHSKINARIHTLDCDVNSNTNARKTGTHCRGSCI